MREEADILVLDEPTAALDAGRSTRSSKNSAPSPRIHDDSDLASASRRCAWRTASSSSARQILEDGSHQELVAAGARYAHLFSLQAKGYLN